MIQSQATRRAGLTGLQMAHHPNPKGAKEVFFSSCIPSEICFSVRTRKGVNLKKSTCAHKSCLASAMMLRVKRAEGDFEGMPRFCKKRGLDEGENDKGGRLV
jgi:hypothetical protein